MEFSALEAVFGFVFNNIQYLVGLILLFSILIYFEEHSLVKTHLPFLNKLIPSKLLGSKNSQSGIDHPKTEISQPDLDHQKLNLTEEGLNEKSYEILHQAIQKSQEMLSQAELDTIKQTAQTRMNLNKYEQGLESELSNLVQTSKEGFTEETKQLNAELKTTNQEFTNYLTKLEAEAQANIEQVRTHINESQRTFAQFLTDLSTKSQTLQAENQEESKKRIDNLFHGIEDKISDYLIQNEQKLMMSIDLELRSARQLIDTYKVQQLSIIDENIVAMLEKTLSLVLSKKLNLRDQMDLVYEALEKAKVEKFIV